MRHFLINLGFARSANFLATFFMNFAQVKYFLLGCEV